MDQQLLYEYPYPIAKCYEKLLRVRTPAERGSLSRYLFEATLKYSACVAIADCLHRAQPDSMLRDAFTCLTKPSLGHWTNLLRQCLRASQASPLSPLGVAWLERTGKRPAMLSAYNELRAFSSPSEKHEKGSVSALSFAEAVVSYRNRSVGHGAPQVEHVERFGPLLEQGVLEFLKQLEVLRVFPLVYVGEIRAQRRTFVHSMTRLMGVTQVPLPDYITAPDLAMLGSDRTLILMNEAATAPLVSLHPLAVYVRDEVYLLQACDLGHTVSYLCHHTGDIHRADHLYEDFRDKCSAFMGEMEDKTQHSKADAVYESALRVSLVDGEIQAEERVYLEELASHVGVDAARAELLERKVREASQDLPCETETLPATLPSDASSAVDVSGGSLALVLEKHDDVLRRLGRIVLGVLSRRSDPSHPMPTGELAKRLSESKDAGLGAVSPQQLARVLADVQNHGFAPGLTRSARGYGIVEDHLAFKVTRDRDLKEELARAAVQLIPSGARIGLDGGSTTLPIARAISAELESEMLTGITIVTNSLPVVQEFSELVERRAWSDDDAPVEVLLCSGRIRPVTRALAEPREGGGETRESLEGLLRVVGGLDLCFVGANGLTVEEGITMPTDVELRTKRQLLEAAKDAYIVADVTKFGVRYPVRIAGWEENLTVLTNRARGENAELQRVLSSQHTVKIVFAGE